MMMIMMMKMQRPWVGVGDIANHGGLCTTCTFLMLTHSLTHDDEDDDGDYDYEDEDDEDDDDDEKVSAPKLC